MFHASLVNDQQQGVRNIPMLVEACSIDVEGFSDDSFASVASCTCLDIALLLLLVAMNQNNNDGRTGQNWDIPMITRLQYICQRHCQHEQQSLGATWP